MRANAKRFLASRVNRLLVLILVSLVVALIVVIPTVYIRLERNSNEDNSTSSPSANALDASQYAVIRSNFADPCLIKVDDTYYAFATRPVNNVSLHVPVASATNISRWTLHEGYDAMPSLPTWAKQTGDTAVWAPHVVQRADGAFVMYFSVLHHNRTNMHCIGAAISPNIMGPYQPQPEPLSCPFDKGGAIDPTFLADPLSNMSIVLYKADGNAIGSGGACANANLPNRATAFEFVVVDPIDLVTRLDNDNGNDTDTTWSPVDIDSTSIITNSPLDGPNIESPALWFHGYNSTPFSAPGAIFRSYHMLFNRGCFADTSYAVGHIVCWGPQLEPPNNATSLSGSSSSSSPDFRTCRWDTYKDNSTHTHQADTLLRTGVFAQPDGQPAAHLWAPGGPSIDQEGRYMVFHADLEPGWFSQPRRYNRTRGMFVAELGYWGQMTGLKVNRLVLPDGA